MKEHTTHYACDCVLNKIYDLEGCLYEILRDASMVQVITRSTPRLYGNGWVQDARSLLKDKLKGVHDGNVQSTRPPRKRNGVRVSNALPTSHRLSRNRGGKK